MSRYTVVMELIPDEAGQLNCVETWPRLPQLAYGSFINIMQFVIPFATMFVCYTRSHEHALPVVELETKVRGRFHNHREGSFSHFRHYAKQAHKHGKLA